MDDRKSNDDSVSLSVPPELSPPTPSELVPDVLLPLPDELVAPEPLPPPPPVERVVLDERFELRELD